jgi:uncharacterized protein YjbI with pentapeptide repeats
MKHAHILFMCFFYVACGQIAKAQEVARRKVPMSYIEEFVKNSPKDEHTIFFEDLEFYFSDINIVLDIKLMGEKNVIFENCKFYGIVRFVDSSIDTMRFVDSSIDLFRVKDSHINRLDLQATDVNNFILRNSSFKSINLSSNLNSESKLIFSNIRFKLHNTLLYKSLYSDPLLLIYNFNCSSIDIYDSVFPDSLLLRNVIISDSKCKTLQIENNVFESAFILNRISDVQDVRIINNSFTSQLDLEGFQLPDKQFIFPFSQVVKHKLAIFESSTDTSNIPVTTLTDSVATNENLPSLQLVYANLYNAYRETGDRKSANACYVEIKELETKVLAYDYAKDRTTEAYFGLQVNRLIGFFCDYGTNPAKALIYSFYLVLIFAGVYAVFPSTPDNLQRRRWLPYYQNLIRYLSETVQLPDLHADRISSRLAGLKSFRSSLDERGEDMPKVIRWLALWHYNLSMLSYRFRQWLYHKADVLPVTWQHLTRLQRLSVSFRLAGYTFLFLFAGFFMRSLNALALSLNAFVTLGYGEIQARGVARYLAVLEGVCGWFLLSIFSVSLISQLLQ